ncbi:MAG TPA: universal stress protein [Polyangiaceae bacterium]
MKNTPYILLVGTDFSELADRALQEAFAQASQRPNAEVHVLTALPIVGEDPGYAVSVYATLDENPVLERAIERLRAHVELELEKFRVANPTAQSTFRVVSHAQADSPVHGLVQLASDLSADLIVIGTHNRKGVQRVLLGSVAEATVRNARCPVLVIPAPPEPEAEVQFTPACAACVQARVTSAGKELWCAQHSERHGRRHTYHQSDRSGSESNFPLVFR